ncbi:MAG: hypothetical protein ACLRT5_07165 [Lachnospiraceae bacterium]
MIALNRLLLEDIFGNGGAFPAMSDFTVTVSSITNHDGEIFP